MTKPSSIVKERYNRKTYDQINIRVKKGEKEKITEAAQKADMSLNAYVVEAIEEKMKGS